jgi:hypothetical protein
MLAAGGHRWAAQPVQVRNKAREKELGCLAGCQNLKVEDQRESTIERWMENNAEM